MGRLKDAVVAQRRTSSIPCVVIGVRAALGADDLAEFEEMMAGDFKLYPAAAISRGLKELGITASDQMLNRHRRGGCSCRH